MKKIMSAIACYNIIPEPLKREKEYGNLTFKIEDYNIAVYWKDRLIGYLEEGTEQQFANDFYKMLSKYMSF